MASPVTEAQLRKARSYKERDLIHTEHTVFDDQDRLITRFRVDPLPGCSQSRLVNDSEASP